MCRLTLFCLACIFVIHVEAGNPREFCKGKDIGIFADPEDCQSFYECFPKNMDHKTCSKGLLFSPTQTMCDWDNNVQCRETPSTKAPTAKGATTATKPDLDTIQDPPTATSTTTLRNDYVSACYVSNWSQYRPGKGSFFPSDIDPFLCTHLLYAFGTISGNQVMYYWDGAQLYNQAMKSRNPGLKSLLAVGGWVAASAPFTAICSTETNRRDFASNSTTFLRKWGFDGLDIDWEYPAQRGGTPEDKENYVLMLQALMDEFESEALQSGNPRLILTAAVPAGKWNIDAGYKVPEISKILDYIFLMSYDFHGAWNSYTGHNAPLHARSDEWGTAVQYNVNRPQSIACSALLDSKQWLEVVKAHPTTAEEWAAKYWVSKGAPKSKLVVGLATYGRTFLLENTGNRDLGAPTVGPGPAGPFTMESGYNAYYEICKKRDSNPSERYWDPEGKVPYLVVGSEWIGYDDRQSLSLKLDWIIQEDFAGAMVWNIDLDDFTGTQCGEGKYPLINVIKNKLTGSSGLGGGNDDDVGVAALVHTVKPSTVSTLAKPISGQDYSDFCKKRSVGLYAHPSDCSKFLQCYHHTTYIKQCIGGLLFNPTESYCDWPKRVQCPS